MISTLQTSNFKILAQIQSKGVNSKKRTKALLIQKYKPTLDDIQMASVGTVKVILNHITRL